MTAPAVSYSGHPLSPPRSHPPRAFPLAVTPVSPVPPWKRAGAKKTGTSLKCGKLGADPCGPSSGHLGVLQNVLGGAAKDQLPQPAQSRSGSICRKVERGTPKCLATWVGFTPARSADRIALRFVGGISRSPRSARPLDRFGSLMPVLMNAGAALCSARSNSGAGFRPASPASLRCSSPTSSLKSMANSRSERLGSLGRNRKEPDEDRTRPDRRRAAC